MAPQLDERRPPVTPQMAGRVAVFGGIAFVLFAIIFFRLWFLQVLSGDDYIVQARQNRVRKERIDAPRGNIVDRNGAVLVKSVASPTVILHPSQMPPPGTKRRHLYRKLGKVLNMSAREVQDRVFAARKHDGAFVDIRVKTGVSPGVYTYLSERKTDFPGVDVSTVYLRDYPHNQIAASLLGATREISAEELKNPLYKGVQQGSRIGFGGIEQVYDQYLRGTDGFRRYQVDSQGNPTSQASSEHKPVQGRSIRLSLDLKMQTAAMSAIQNGINAAHTNGHPGSAAGAFVAMNPMDGEVYAMGSYPSYNANELAKPISQKRFDQIKNEKGSPLFDRSLTGLYPTGSTFKPITSLGVLESHVFSPDQTIDDTGKFEFGVFKGDTALKNAENAKFGTINLVKALEVSSDVFFYTLGLKANAAGPVIQKWAHKLGLGEKTGIDLPNESEGFVPERKNINRKYADYRACIAKYHLNLGSTAGLYKCGGYDSAWDAGDNVNLAVGQGKFTATPLQMARAYSAILNGGYLVHPRLGEAVEDVFGTQVQEIPRATKSKIGASPEYLQVIKDGLRRAAGAPDGTSYAVMKGFPLTVYGKTGTVQRTGQDDQAWYVCGVIDPKNPKHSIVVAVTIEKGGFGAETAAPAARQILNFWYSGDKSLGKFRAGDSKTL